MKSGFEAFFNQAAVGVSQLDLDGTFLEINKKLCSIVGYSYDELISKTFYFLTYPDDLQTVMNYMDQLLEDEIKTFSIEKRFFLKNKNIIWVNLTASLVRDSNNNPDFFITIIQDITNRKALEEERDNLAKFPSENPNPVLRISAEGKLLYANHAAETVLKCWNTTSGKDVPPRWKQIIKEVLSTGALQKKEEYIFDRLLTFSVSPIEVEDYVNLYGSDITDQKRIEDELIESDKLYRAISDYTYDWESWINPEGKLLWVNSAVEKITGYSVSECMAMNDYPFSIIAHSDRQLMIEKCKEALQKKSLNNFEFKILKKDGTPGFMAISWQPIYSDAKVWLGYRSSVRDVTDRKQAEAELKSSEEKYFKLIDNLGVGVVLHALDTSILYCNPKASEILGLNSEQIIGKKAIDPRWKFVREDGTDLPLEEYPVNRIFKARRSFSDYTIGIKRPDRDYITWVNVNASLVYDTKGKIKYASIAFSDTTEQWKAEEKLKESEERLNLIIKGSNDAPWDWDFANEKIYYAPQWWRQIGYEPNELPADDQLWQRLLHPDDAEKVQSLMEQATAEEINSYELEMRLQHKDGHYVSVLSRGIITRNTKGEMIRLSGTNMDLTERKEAERALIESQERYQKAQIVGHVGNWEYDPETTEFWASDEAKRILGLDLSDTTPLTTEKVEKCIVEKESIHKALIDLVAQNTKYDEVYNIVTPDDDISKMIHSIAEIERDAQGNPVKVTGVINDVTEKHKMEEQLRQSQKMKAVGQLAGGIAHDFNNMLAGIMGCAEILAKRVGDNQKLKKYVNLIIDSTMQAAELTQKLLAFSRKGQIINELFDVHESISKVSVMLNHSFDKRIEIHTDLKAHMCLIKGDRSQIQNAILNLCINARDAMPGGGKLIIRTKNIQYEKGDIEANSNIVPGQYIEIDVEDTGSGMSREVKGRIFEPFFTTKGLGKGTGLGLAVVYNTINENKGFINIYSEINKGTVIKIFLPVTLDSAVIEEKNQEEPLMFGSGSILVADDESTIRIITGENLSRLGYHVLYAGDGKECID
ncbi:MAG: PAS domain S-box protein, partial [Spirochaetaceae bacterium]|nr:PAS domain S-box protein [Spirochaetaceae bacterium]